MQPPHQFAQKWSTIFLSLFKNSLIFIFDPSNNSTILSENHREIIINHYLSKSYQPELFISDLKEIFEPYNLSTQNEINYTNLLSEIIYVYESDWKAEKIITFKEFIEQLKKYKSENDVNFNLEYIMQWSSIVIEDKENSSRNISNLLSC